MKAKKERVSMYEHASMRRKEWVNQSPRSLRPFLSLGSRSLRLQSQPVEHFRLVSPPIFLFSLTL
jgi:hypothetical protein